MSKPVYRVKELRWSLGFNPEKPMVYGAGTDGFGTYEIETTPQKYALFFVDTDMSRVKINNFNRANGRTLFEAITAAKEHFEDRIKKALTEV